MGSVGLQTVFYSSADLPSVLCAALPQSKKSVTNPIVTSSLKILSEFRSDFWTLPFNSGSAGD